MNSDISTTMPSDISAAMNVSVKQLKLSLRTQHMLIRKGILTVGQLASTSDEVLLKIKRFGPKSLEEVHSALANIKLSSEGIFQKQQRPADRLSALEAALSDIKDLPIDMLKLNDRTTKILRRAGAYSLEDLINLSKPIGFDRQNMNKKSPKQMSKILAKIDIDELQRVAHNLREQGKMPANIPISRLDIEAKLCQQLRSLGIGHFEHLRHYTRDDLYRFGFQPHQVNKIATILRAYGLTLSTDTDVSEETVRQGLPPVRRTDVATTNHERFAPVELIEHMLAELTLREAEVLRLRYGLDGREAFTLEAIGRRIDRTRERVRQIEKKAIGRLQRPHSRYIIQPLIRLLEQGLEDANGVMSAQAAQEIFRAHADGTLIFSESIMDFILLFAHTIAKIKDLPIIALNRSPYNAYIPFVNVVCAFFERTLVRARTPLSADELLARFAADSDEQNIKPQLLESFLIACLKAHPDIVIDERGVCRLKRRSNN